MKNTLLSRAHALALDLVDLVAPPLCVACREPFPLRPPLCTLCREHLVDARDPPADVTVAFEHGGPLARAIYRAKYDGDPAVAVALGALLSERFVAPEVPVDVVVPVPLHGRRLRERGYNQSVELARTLARRLRVPLMVDGARRIKDTPSQTKLDREARRRNVEGVFTVGPRLRRARVLLVDDVVTTGSTLAALRTAVLEAGAEAVYATALACAPLEFR